MPAPKKYDRNGGAACLSAVGLLPITHLRPRMEFFLRAMKGLFPAERLLCAGRASPSPAQLLAFAPGKEQAAGVREP